MDKYISSNFILTEKKCHTVLAWWSFLLYFSSPLPFFLFAFSGLDFFSFFFSLEADYEIGLFLFICSIKHCCLKKVNMILLVTKNQVSLLFLE